MERQNPQLSEAVARLRTGYSDRNPQSLSLYREARKSLSGGGTRSSIFVDPFPLFVKNGKGAYLTDVDEHKYLDLVSDFTSGIYGHSEPGIAQAIATALAQGIQLGAHTLHEADFAKLICSRFPSMDLLRFANSGTEANLLAIATAIKYTGKNKVVVFEGGYHGSLLSHFKSAKNATRTETASSRQYENNVLNVPFDFLVCPYNDLSTTIRLVETCKDSVAAIIVEPMLGAGGCVPGDPSFLHGLRDLATQIGSVLIFDEVQTARLGVSGRQGILGIKPDLTTLGKFFGGGFAFGAFGGKEEIMKMFDSKQPGAVSHGGTFNNSVLTMVAGAYATEYLLTESALSALNKRGDNMRSNLNNLFSERSFPFVLTGLGSINQVHCLLKGVNKTLGLDLLFFYMLEQGIWFAQRGLIALSFAVTDTDIRRFVDAVKAFEQEYAELLRIVNR